MSDEARTIMLLKIIVAKQDAIIATQAATIDMHEKMMNDNIECIKTLKRRLESL